MPRVDELQKKYPTLPRETIIKMDALRHGIKDSEVLDRVGVWQRRLPIYQSHDHDLSRREIAEKRPETVRPGYILHLSPFYLKNAIGVRVERDSTSPYEFKELGSGQFGLYEGEEKVESIYFARHKRRKFDEDVTSQGIPVASLVDIQRSCFVITPLRFCEYFAFGEQCKFCNYNYTYEDAQAVGADRAATINLMETVEAYKIATSSTTFVEGRFLMGGLRSSEKEARIHLDFVESIAKAASHKPNLSVHTQPISRKEMQRLKDVGLNCLTFQMEVWDRRLFAEICPGKDKHTGHERYKEACHEAVDTFGAGNVGNVFVGSVTMMPPSGHQTWQESRDSLIEGNRWMIKNGVFPVFLTLRLGVGSTYGEDKSNQQKLAPTEYYLDTILAHHNDVKEYGLYSKLNKLMFCPMDCLANHYSGEVGFVEKAGNLADWLADCVPGESNWLAQFPSSTKTQ
ncbi:MAG: hypothetical protein Q7O66_06675, partial [Dehalococcoidia bacterium]|nr:hypothetical protein [Dehalococcoidia bacterium]